MFKDKVTVKFQNCSYSLFGRYLMDLVVIEMPESVWVHFPLPGLLEFHQQAYLQHRVLCVTHPRLAPSQSASLRVFHGFLEWVVGIFYLSERVS